MNENIELNYRVIDQEFVEKNPTYSKLLTSEKKDKTRKFEVRRKQGRLAKRKDFGKPAKTSTLDLVSPLIIVLIFSIVILIPLVPSFNSLANDLLASVGVYKNIPLFEFTD